MRKMLTLVVGVIALVALATQQADAQVITYRISPDILTELQDRYPDHSTDYWNDARNAIRDGIEDWSVANPNLIFTPRHNDRYDVIIEWIDSTRAWGIEYHDQHTGHRIGIDFDSPEPDEYGASLMNPDIIRYVMAHELGHTLGLGHTSEEGHLMYGLANPRPDQVFDDMGYTIPHITIQHFENVGGDRVATPFHLKGYNITSVDVMYIDDTPYLVAGAGKDGLHILDISNLSRPKAISSYDTFTTDVGVVPNRQYIVLFNTTKPGITGFDTTGFDVLDVSDPTNITLASTVVHPNKQHWMLDGAIIEVDGKPFVLTVAWGMLHQYDISNPYDIRRTGAHSDDFGMLGVERVQGVVRDGTAYAVVDATYDGTLVFILSTDRNPALQRQHTGLQYDDILREYIEIDEITYRIQYWNGQIVLHELATSGNIPMGRLLGYEVWEFDTLRIDGRVYAVVAAGPDGILGIYVGEEGTGKWTFG